MNAKQINIIEQIELIQIKDKDLCISYPRNRFNEFTKNPAKVSIVIPVFNSSKNLKRCVKSALQQTFKNYQIIIIDNNSTDSTWTDACLEASKHSNILCIQNSKNIGRIENWNRALELTTSEYIKPLMVNDTINPDYLTKLVPILDENPDVNLCRSSILFKKSETEKKPYHLYSEQTILSGKEALRESLNIGNIAAGPSSQIIRRSTLEQSNIRYNTGLQWASDYYFSIKIFETGCFAYYPEALYTFDATSNRFFNQAHPTQAITEESSLLFNMYKDHKNDIPKEYFTRSAKNKIHSLETQSKNGSPEALDTLNDLKQFINHVTNSKSEDLTPLNVS